MTLSTDVHILDEVDPFEVFRFCQGLLTKYDDPRHMPIEEQKIRHEQDGGWKLLADGETAQDGQRSYVGNDGVTRVWAPEPGRPWSLDNEVGQGLPAWLMTAYRPGAPLRAENGGHDEDCDEDCTGNYHDRACWMSVDFDTTYGYRDARGWGCGDLHAALVAELGAWLTAKGVRWEWRNEFTGEWHDNNPEALAELVSGGVDAGTWFMSTALPAIAGEMARSGGGELDVAGRKLAVPDLSGGGTS